jgi:hypothetical protein
MIWLAAAALLGISAKEVRSVDIYVTPYYSSAAKASKRVVSVDRRFDALLKSDRREDVVNARDQVLADPALVSPITMMVLASRLYDVGERDDAVFWFYVAKDRYMTVAGVLVGFDRGGMGSGGAEVASAMGAFVQLAGPTINSYAFCDVAKQQALRRKAYDWVVANPYQAVFAPELPAKGEDRAALLTAALDKVREGMEQETAYLTDADNLATLKARRAENKVDALFCWRD